MSSYEAGQASPSGMRILVDLARSYPRLLFLIFLLAFLSSLVSAPTPYLAKIIIDDLIFRGGSAGAHEVSGWLGVSHTVWMIAAIVLLGILLKVLGSLLGGWQCHYILQITRNSLTQVRLDTALRVMGGAQQKLEKIEPSRIASRLGFDVNAMDSAIFALLRNFVTSAFLVLVVLGFMVFLDPFLSMVVLATMPLTAVLSVMSHRKLQEFSREESDRVADLTATAAETFGALRIIRVFTAEPFFLGRLQTRCEALRFEGLHHWTRFHSINLLLSLLSSLGGDIFLLVGGILAINGRITFGEFFAFYGYQAMLWGPIGVLLNSGQFVQTGTASAEKVHELAGIEQEPYLVRPRRAREGAFRGEIVAENLGFSYNDGEPVLRDINFRIEPGTMVALVGQSGSGKTTLANLLLGMYLPTHGRLLIDGRDIREWDMRDLRGNMGVVLQDATLFHDTIRTNVCMGREYPEQRIWAALAAAHIDDFVRALPNQLEEQAGISGTRLSGGQKQRLAIARVFLKNPAFLILDEATSALDSETEKAIQRSFDALMAGRTAAVIAHRLSTIYQADQILVLHQGRLVECGTHEELVTRPAGHYRELYEAQVEGMIPMSGATRRPWNRQAR
ncbi:MAG: ABC transporter ATP-binding protein [Terrimicrobiaceae bacterium]|nr:ABC transporter ATP-binding protein [Terrimicrobiaceae bacterium]